MTMPHLMNCLHSEDGWCLECVKVLQEEKESVENSCDWYSRRCALIQRLQHHIPDPYRTAICNVLANEAFHFNSLLTAEEALDRIRKDMGEKQ